MVHISRSRFPACCFMLALAAAPAIAGFAGTDVFLPMVGRQPGVFPSDWYTTVWVYNPSADTVVARLYLLERNTTNPSPPWVEVTVPAADTLRLENVVETLFTRQVFGAMRVTAPSKLVVTSRVFSRGAGAGEKDSVGQDFAGVPAAFAIGAGEKTQILGTYQTLPSADSEFRYNIGLVETTGHSATVRVRAFDSAGAEQGSKDLQVREYSQRQVAFKDNFPAVSTENTRLEVEVISGSGRVIAYGSGIANGSQDPTTYEMQYSDTLLGIANVQHDATLKGDGSAGAPLGIAEGGVGTSLLPDLAVTSDKLADEAVTVHKLATVPSPLPPPGSFQASAMRDDPLEQFFKMGDWMFWAPAFTGDITAVFTDPDSGLTGGMTWADAHLAIADGGVTAPRLADRSVTAVKIDAVPPSGGDPLKLQWSPTTGEMSWGPDFDKVCPLGFICASTTNPVFRVTNTAAGIALQGDAETGTGVRGETTSGFAGVDGRSTSSYGVHGRSEQGIGVYGLSVGSVSPSLAIGVRGRNDVGTGVDGQTDSGTGTRGTSVSGSGVEGVNSGTTGSAGRFKILEGRSGSPSVYATTEGIGPAVLGESNNGTYLGALGRNGQAVYGDGYNHTGYLGSAEHGAYGKEDSSGRYGYLGSADFGVYGADSSQTVYGYIASADNGLGGRNGSNWGRIGTPDYAGYFNGWVGVSTLTGTGNHDVYANAGGTLINVTSDARLKINVAPLTDTVDVVAALAALRGVTYNWDTSLERARDLGDRREIGMLAQEVEAVLPELVDVGGDGYRTLDYAKLTAFLIEVAKAQQAEIEQLRAAIGRMQVPSSR